MVGLGNPTADLEGTRHNAGAEAIALLAGRHGARLRTEKGTRSVAAECDVGGKRVALAVPQTFMNESGVAVRALVRRYGIEALGRLVVLHDELDLPVGTVRVKSGGGLAGHNGLRSIVDHLHGQDFVRVRIGIGRPPGSRAGADHVLRRPGKAEREQLDVSIAVAADAVEAVVARGVEAAMNEINGRS